MLNGFAVVFHVGTESLTVKHIYIRILDMPIIEMRILCCFIGIGIIFKKHRYKIVSKVKRMLRDGNMEKYD